MKNCATYKNTGGDLSDCKSVNFIFGANGSGKSTISNYLMNPADSKYKDCSITWDKGIEEDVLVYNRAFKEANFSKTSIDGVFTIGEASIEEQNALEAKKNQLSQRIIEQVNTKETLNKKKDELNRLEHDSKEAVWNNILKKYEKDYAEAFTGFRNNKDKFYAEVNRRYENLQDRDFDTSELSQRAKTLFGEKPSSCDCISLEIENELMKAKLIETDSIWTTAVVGSKDVPIGALIHKLHSNDWVNEGRKFIEGESDVCPFCQQHTITDDFRNQLENFFDDTYKNQVERISTFSDEYEIAINNITTLMTEMTANEESIKVGKLDKELLLSKIELFKQIIAQNKQKIREKK